MLLALLLALLVPLHVDAGPYAGAFRVAPGGAVNWYFATTSLLRLRELPERETRRYLDAYLAHLDPNGGIADVLPEPTGVYAPIAPDSEDAYASTFLSLAVRYRAVSHDETWWKRNVAALSAIAYAKLLTQVKPNGLIRASRTDQTGYTMDNAENYAGLRDFAGVLRATHDPKATYVTSFVRPLGIAIHRLYDEREHAFLWSDSDPMGPLLPYPACTAQLFPQLYGVAGASRVTDSAHFAGARALAARCRLSAETSPHESLLYAVFIRTLSSPTQRERRFARDIAGHAFDERDIVTISLLDALRADNRHVTTARSL